MRTIDYYETVLRQQLEGWKIGVIRLPACKDIVLRAEEHYCWRITHQCSGDGDGILDVV
jgi:hypothetical protein